MKNLNIKNVALKLWKIFKWAIFVLVGLFILLIIVRIPHYFKVQKTNDQIVKIHNTKLTMDDVEGKNLPPDPGSEADKTVQGIDANNNGIRDDVELAIFKEYPNSAKTRAVLLQYALALQMIFIQPFINEEIATETIREGDRAYTCIGKVLIRDDNDEKVMDKYFKDSEELRSFVENRQLNTQDRIKNNSDFYKKVRSYSDLEGDCDIDLSKLQN